MSTTAVGSAASVPRPLPSALVSTDHKVIAKRTAALALGFLALGGTLALVMRSELADPGLQVVSTAAYNQLFTMHGSIMIFLVATPLVLALGMYLVPLQLGARRIAGPRIVLAGHWLWVAGGAAMLASFLAGQGAASAGWTAYLPLSGGSETPSPGMDFWIYGVLLVAAGSTLMGAGILGTLLRLRAPEMSLLRMPPFCWAMLVTVLMVLMAFPALIAAMALLSAERELGGIFDSVGGPIAYQHLFWFFGHPVVYVLFFPFVGIVAEVIATFSGRRFFGYRAFVIALIVFTGLSMSVWAHHMFTTGQVANEYFALTSTLLVIPAGVEYFDSIATLWKGRPRLSVPMLFALGFLAQFVIGGVSGVFVASPPLDYHVHDSYFVVAHFHYTLFAGSLFAFFAAAYHWFPKMTGALLREGLGKVQFWLLVIGTNLTFFPMFLLGQDGMPRRIADYAAETGFTTLNRISTLGSFLVGIAVALFFANLVLSLRRRRDAGPDPWGGQTLEWATSSPPPKQNFDTLPPVRSFAPLLDLDPADRREGEPAAKEPA